MAGFMGSAKHLILDPNCVKLGLQSHRPCTNKGTVISSSERPRKSLSKEQWKLPEPFLTAEESRAVAVPGC